MSFNQTEYQKQYREKNKNKILEYDKQYREKNKEKIRKQKHERNNHSLKLATKYCNNWTIEDLQFIAVFFDESIEEIASALGRTISSITYKRNQLRKYGFNLEFHLKFNRKAIKEWRKNHSEAIKRWHKKDVEKNNESLKLAKNHYDNWTIEDSQFLVAFMDEPTKEIAESLGRTISSINNKRIELRKSGFVKEKS